MSEWDLVIPVVGTLSGTVVGLLFGYISAQRIEARKEKHRKEMTYRRELTKHMDDIIKPLYHLVEELWSSLAILNETTRGSNKIGEKGLWIDATNTALKNLSDFCFKNDSQISLLLPNAISGWVFAPIGKSVREILSEAEDGNDVNNLTVEVVNALMQYQENLKVLIGYETELKLEPVYPFPSKIPKLQTTDK